MWSRTFVVVTLLNLILSFGMPLARADTLTFNDGSEMNGIIKKVSAGKVVVQIGNEEKVFDVLDIKSMDFDTPHLLNATANIPIDHFLKDIEAQEIVRNIEQIEKTEAQIHTMLNQIRSYWGFVQPIESSKVKAWEAAKEDFRKPLSRYQELLNDLYFHVLAKVDNYNDMAKEARDVYVGVKGLRIGSALIPKEMEKLPLSKYVPGAWYDTIYYNGYNRGWDEAYEKYAAGKSN